MATSEDLVPTGQPHGDRLKNVAAMRQAQLPLSSQGGQAAASPTTGTPSPAQAGVAGAASGPVGAPAPADLSTFDVFQGREPPPAAPGQIAPAPTSMLQTQIATTQNAVMQDLFKHTSRYMEG